MYWLSNPPTWALEPQPQPSGGDDDIPPTMISFEVGMAEQGRILRPGLTSQQVHRHAAALQAFVAGFRSGVTWIGCTGVLKHAYRHPKGEPGYFARRRIR